MDAAVVGLVAALKPWTRIAPAATHRALILRAAHFGTVTKLSVVRAVRVTGALATSALVALLARAPLVVGTAVAVDTRIDGAGVAVGAITVFFADHASVFVFIAVRRRPIVWANIVRWTSTARVLAVFRAVAKESVVAVRIL